ncbi:MAG: hypothetical protein JWQ19_672 [Subtercola sp.]|nr:hypothetical protein [Subtercola sp.]
MSARRPRVGWYVHHQGAGHTSRFLAVREALDADVVVFSSAAAPTELGAHTEWVLLDRDDTVEVDARADPGEPGSRDPQNSAPTARGLLHWAPLHHAGHASRLASIAGRIDTDRFDAFVVDVSVEVTVLARLMGVPTVVFTQPGERTDRPHQLALDAADAVIAPWPGSLYRPHWLDRAGDRVHYVGGISRFAHRERTAHPVPGTVLFIAGAGGATLPPDALDDAIAATPGFTWRLVGHASGDTATGRSAGTATGGSGVTAADAMGGAAPTGWVADPFDALCSAEVVVSWAGQNAITDLAATDARAIVIAQPRPFDEQNTTARVLADARLAVTAPQWPATEQWPALLTGARVLRPDWSRWQAAGATERAAAVIARVAAGSSS